MSAHTPGPWKAEYSEGDEWDVLAGESLPIAYISGWACSSVEANARLIAAAPDLLAALKAARVFVAQRAGYSDVADQTLVDVDAAIAKAEGR